MRYRVLYLGCAPDYYLGRSITDEEIVEASSPEEAVRAFNTERECKVGDNKGERYEVTPIAETIVVEVIDSPGADRVIYMHP